MREIKFRGKRVDNGEWVYGFYFEGFTGIPYILVLHDHILGMTKYYEVIPETVGQYTGLKDKNGVETYESDVISFEFKGQNLVGKVLFEKGSFIVVSNKLSDGFVWLYKIIECIESDVIDGVVIGNIYDNPELLGGETE